MRRMSRTCQNLGGENKKWNWAQGMSNPKGQNKGSM